MTDDLQAQLARTLGGTYAIERELTGGGMSRVFVARDTALSRQVVIKVLPPELFDAVARDRFLQEIGVAARLQHPHIVPLLTTGEVDGMPWFSMPYVDGESLRARVARGELPITDVVHILRDVAMALAYAHGHGVVHRDIKPDNVLLSGGSAMVTDFGIARAIDSSGQRLTQTGIALGTPAYMAPEQAAADSRTDHRADLYALGVLGYELLVGHAPFSGRSPQATLAAQLTETATPVEQLRAATPPGLAHLVMRCLAKSAADRPQTADEIVRALDSVATPAGMAAAVPLAAASKRRRLAGVAIVTLLIAGAAWFATHRTSASTLNPRRIAVAPCDNLTTDTALKQIGRIAADYLASQIAQADSVQVVPGATVSMIVSDTTIRGDIITRIAKATHAGSIVTCSISRFGDSLRVDSHLVDATTGTIKRAFDPATGPVSDPLAAVSALRERLLGALVTGDLERSSTTIDQPPKYSAYLVFMEGRERFLRLQDYAGTIPFFTRAIEIDSSLTDAYDYLAVSYRVGQQWTQLEKLLTAMAARRDVRSPKDRLVLEYHQASLRGDLFARYAVMQRRRVREAGNSGAANDFGMAANSLLHSSEALGAFREIDSLSTAQGWAPMVTQMAIAMHLLGDHKGELARLEKARREFPGNFGIVAQTLNALAAVGDSTGMFALLDTLARGTVDPDNVQFVLSILVAAEESRAHGHMNLSLPAAARALEWLRSHPSRKPSAQRTMAEGRTFLLSGMLDSAQARFQSIVRDSMQVGIGGYLGLIAAQSGDTVRAASIADSLGALDRKWMFGANKFFQAGILGELGRKQEALAALDRAARTGRTMQTWHASAFLSSLRGFPDFEALITVK